MVSSVELAENVDKFLTIKKKQSNRQKIGQKTTILNSKIKIVRKFLDFILCLQ